MVPILFTNARVFDGASADCLEGVQVLVEGGLIQEVSDRPIKIDSAYVVDVGGRTLMPGLIDAHMHAYFSDVNWHGAMMAANAMFEVMISGRGCHGAMPEAPCLRRPADVSH